MEALSVFVSGLTFSHEVSLLPLTLYIIVCRYTSGPTQCCVVEQILFQMNGDCKYAALNV